MGKEIITRAYNNKDIIDSKETSKLEIELKEISKNYGSTLQNVVSQEKVSSTKITVNLLCPSASEYFKRKLDGLNSEEVKNEVTLSPTISK